MCSVSLSGKLGFQDLLEVQYNTIHCWVFFGFPKTGQNFWDVSKNCKHTVKSLTLHVPGGGHIVPALQKTCSCSSLFGLRDPKFWYNSYIIVTLDVLNLRNQKCVSKKNWSMFFDAGVKNQKLKNGKMTPKTILSHAHTNKPKMAYSRDALTRDERE